MRGLTLWEDDCALEWLARKLKIINKYAYKTDFSHKSLVIKLTALSNLLMYLINNEFRVQA
jgi:hypothetical protein